MIFEQHDPHAPGTAEDDLDLVDVSPEPRPELSEADYRGCRWIDGAPAPLRRGMFCGKPTRPGSAWCPEHYRIAFGRIARKRDAA